MTRSRATLAFVTTAQAGTLALAAVGAFSVILVILHFLKPEFDPSWRMISEYEIGRYGWLMRLAFVCWSASVVGVDVALSPSLSTAAVVALAIVAIGPLGAAIFATEPTTRPLDQTGTAHRLHAVFGALFILGFPIAATLAGQACLTGVPWIGLIAFLGATRVYGARGGRRAAPEVLIGWPNRFMVATYVLWIGAVATTRSGV